MITDTACQCGITNDDTVTSDSPKSEVVDNRIINGHETKPNEFPWQVALVKSGGHSPICGGSIISDKHILTASHCTTDVVYVSDIEVLVGEHDLMTTKDECQRIRISRIHEHHNYNPKTVAYDFSILVLAETLHFSK